MNRFFQALLHPAEDADPQLRSELRGMMPGMLVEQFASTLLDNVNVIVMGLIGNAAIAGVSQVGTINYILMIVFQAFAMGGTALVAQAAGAKQDRRCHRMAGAALLLGLTISGVIALLMFFLRAPLVDLLFGSAEPEVVTNSLLYYGFTALSPPLWFVYFQCSGFMRSCGDTRRPMMVSIFSNVVGILGNLLFTMHLQMGVSGAGLSYLLSVGSGAAAALGLVLRRNFYARPSFRLDRTTLADIGRVSHISTPTALENLLFNGTRLVLQVFLAGMGAVVISSNQVFNSITNLLFIPFMAVNFLTAPLTGRTAGRGGVTAVRPCVGYLYRIGRSIAVWTAAAALLLATPLTLLFCRDAQVIPLVEHMVMLYAPFILFLPGCFILPNGFKAVGDARYAMIFSSVSAWAIRVGGMWLLGLRLGLGTMAIVLTQGLDHFARYVAYKRRYRGDLWLRELTAEHHKNETGR